MKRLKGFEDDFLSKGKGVWREESLKAKQQGNTINTLGSKTRDIIGRSLDESRKYGKSTPKNEGGVGCWLD